MSLENKAKKYHKEAYHLPIDEVDLERFAESILKEYIEELKDNKQTVVWNYGMDSVIFVDKIDSITKDFINGKDTSNEDDQTISAGKRTDGDQHRDEEV